jgi:hypothetical protein
MHKVTPKVKKLLGSPFLIPVKKEAALVYFTYFCKKKVRNRHEGSGTLFNSCHLG